MTTAAEADAMIIEDEGNTTHIVTTILVGILIISSAKLLLALDEEPEQLFTCKLGGRKPTHSGKSLTHSRHFAQMG